MNAIATMLAPFTGNSTFVPATVQSKPTATPKAAAPLSFGTIVKMSRTDVIGMVTKKFGKAPPKSWSREKMAAAYLGENVPEGSYGKMVCQFHILERTGTAAAKSWTVHDMNQKLAGGGTIKPARTKANGEALRLAYVQKTGYMPAKSWTLAVLAERLESGTIPARNAVKAAVVNGTIVAAA